ncbi:MAG TPA: hypothetical protein ENH40_06725 [Nitrospirae bacterium]|nr:hypothetical protein [Nitrospirota bacterium]HDZ62819.1 hypothetical protein [Nitrospirota bacterium]
MIEEPYPPYLKDVKSGKVFAFSKPLLEDAQRDLVACYSPEGDETKPASLREGLETIMSEPSGTIEHEMKQDELDTGKGMSGKTYATVEEALDALVKEKGGGIVGIIKRGDFSKYFSVSLEKDLDEELVGCLFADIGKQMAIGWKYRNRCGGGNSTREGDEIKPASLLAGLKPYESEPSETREGRVITGPMYKQEGADLAEINTEPGKLPINSPVDPPTFAMKLKTVLKKFIKGGE